LLDTARGLLVNQPGAYARQPLQPKDYEMLKDLPLVQEPDGQASVIRATAGEYRVHARQGNNWSITLYLPLELHGEVSMASDGSITRLAEDAPLAASITTEHRLQVSDGADVILLSLPLLHPDLTHAETAALPAVLRAIRRFHAKYGSPPAGQN
jgi:hypothetical protein